MAATAILVVDYEQNIRQLMVGALEGAGYQVFQAESSAAALVVLRNRKIELLLCNVVMPDMNGIELSLRAQEMQPELRVLLTTGHLRGDQIPPVPARRTRLVEQPFRPEVLLTEVQKILRRD